jgi:hypothetical protein
MSHRAILTNCMSRLSGDEAVYIRGLYDLIVLFVSKPSSFCACVIIMNES